MANNKVKEFRWKAGITHLELAEKAGCTKAHLHRVEGGHEAVKIGTALLISDALGIDLSDAD